MGAVTAIYLTGGAPPYTPATIRGAWDDTAGAVHRALDYSLSKWSDTIRSVLRAETSASTEYDVLLYRGISPRLAAQTINCNLDVIIGTQESYSGLNAHWHIHAYVTQGDSDTPRGTLINDYREAAGVNEWPSAPAGDTLNAAQAMNLAVQEGDRIVVELGYTARNTSATSMWGALWYGTQPRGGGAVAALTAGSTNVENLYGSLTFSAAITFLDTDIENRVTRTAVRTLSSQSSDERVTRLVVRTLSPLGSPLRLTREVVRTLSAESTDIRTTRLVVRTLSRQPPPDPCEAPVVGEDLCRVRHPLLWVEWKPGDGTTRAYAEVALPDPSTYHEGYKAPRLLGVSEVRRALAGPRWDYEVGRWSARLADEDRTLRALLATGDTAYWSLRELALYAASDVGRRAQVTPRLMGWGLVDPDVAPTDQLAVELPARDAIGSMPGWGLSLVDLLPKRRVRAPEFPYARLAVRDFGVPVPYGDLTDEGSSDPAPTWDGDAARGASFDPGDGTWVCGWGNLPDPPAAPTNLALVEGAAGGSFGTDAWGNYDFYVFVTAVDASGNESDPAPFLPTTTMITLADGTKTVQASWTASADAVKYRCYLGWLYYSVWHTQYIETAATSCEFTKNPTWVPGIMIAQSDITPGAHLITYGQYWYYSVLAVMPDGRTVLSTAPGLNYSGFGYSGPFRRPVRCQWLPVAGALSYEVYRRAAGGDWDRRWTVDASAGSPAGSPAYCYVDDDQLDTGAEIVDGVPASAGLVTPVYVGNVTIDGEEYAELLVAGCAISDITHWYWDDGANPVEVDAHAGEDFLVPFNAGWSGHFLTDYRDVTGSDGVVYRRTAIYVRNYGGRTRKDEVEAGTATLRINLAGVEDVGNGSGVVVADLYQQAAHFLNQWVIGNYRTGDWSPPPMFPGTSICQVNCPSFTTLTNLRRAELPPDGYVGAVLVGANGERVSANEWLTRWMTSGEFRIGPNRSWQIVARAINENLDTTTLEDVLDVSEIHAPTGDPQPRRAELVNEVRYRYGPDLNPSGDNWVGEATLPDATSIAGYRETAPAEIDLWCVRQSAVAAHVAQRFLNRSKTIPVYVEPEGDLCLERFDLGDAFLYTHYRGLGATGYVSRPVWVVGHTFVPTVRRIRLECLDLGPIVP